MTTTFSILQMVFMGLFLCGAVLCAYSAKKNQSTRSFFGAICMLGLVLITAFPNIWLILCILLMIAGGCLLVYGQAANVFSKTVTGMVLLLTGIIAFAVACGLLNPDEEDELSKKRLQYGLAQYEQLGKVAMEKYSGSDVAVIVPPDMTEQQNEFVKAFEKGYGASVKIVEEKLFDSYAFQEANSDLNEKDYLKKFAAEQEKCSLKTLIRSPELASADVILMLTVPPTKKEECIPFLEEVKKRKKVLLFPADTGRRISVWLEPYIRGKQVGALVLMNVESSIRNEVPEDAEGAFNARYVLVTSENLDEMMNNRSYRVMLTDDSAENAE